MWDIIHPGRIWAENLPSGGTVESVLKLIKCHFESIRVPPGEIELEVN
jgi:hypothetical protein